MMIRSVALLAIITVSASAKDTGGKVRRQRFNEVRKLGGGWDESAVEEEVVEAEPHWDESTSTVQQAKASKADDGTTKASKADDGTTKASKGTVGAVETKAGKGESGTTKASKGTVGAVETHSYSWGEPAVEEVVEAVQQAKASKGDSGTTKASKGDSGTTKASKGTVGAVETHSYSWGEPAVEEEVIEAEPHWEPV